MLLPALARPYPPAVPERHGNRRRRRARGIGQIPAALLVAATVTLSLTPSSALAAGPAAPPADVRSSVVGGDDGVLTWSPPASVDAGNTIERYDVRRFTATGSTMEDRTAPGRAAARSLTWPDLPVGTSWFAVRAVGSGGAGDWARVVVSVPSSPVQPPPVQPPPVQPPPVQPPPVQPPPAAAGGDACGSWERGYTCAVPAGAARFTGTTGAGLAAAIKALPAGGWLTVGSPRITGNVFLSGSDIKPGITVVNAPGTNPTVVGAIDLSDGRDWNWFGIDVTFPSSPAGTHMAKFDGGSGWEVAYSEFYDAACYTLVRPGQGATGWRIHHNRVQDNRPANGANQDHAFYVAGEVARQDGRIDHNLVGGIPNGRAVKIGGPSSSSGQIGGVRIDHNTFHDADGPSAVQVSNGATGNLVENNVAYRSGSSTAFTDGAGSQTGNVYRSNASDIRTGPDTTNFRDGGGNVRLSLAQLQDPALMATLGLGHRAG